MCDIVCQKHDTLLALDITWNNDFVGTFCKCLRAPKLQELRLSSHLNNVQMRDLCHALDKMAFLRCLHVGIDDDAAVPFASFFRSAFRPIQVLGCSFFHVAESEVLALLHAVKNNTKLRILEIYKDSFPLVIQSELLEEGYLVKCGELGPPLLEHLAGRNKQRHCSCQRACVALIAVCRNKRALKLIGVDVVRMIAMWLWDTRNQSFWDK